MTEKCQSETQMAKFWAKVDKGPHPRGCWLYTGFIKWDGYGWLARSMNGKVRYMTAHRYAWILKHGIPPKGMCILHNCDVAACCNPAHLRLGTHAENMRDSYDRRRHCFGERNTHAKLNYEKVCELRRLRDQGWKFTELAKRYGLTQPGAWLAYYKCWKIPRAAGPSLSTREPRPVRR